MTVEYFPPTPAAPLPDDLRRWAREMRHAMTDAEALLWKLLRNRRVAGAKFRRQHPVGRYILDFYCDEKKLAIELDGGQHQEAVPYDSRRSEWLRTHGIAVLRFWNNEVLMETEAVLEVIYQALTTSLRSSALTCSARTGLQACTVQQAGGVPPEIPASPPNPSPTSAEVYPHLGSAALPPSPARGRGAGGEGA